MKTVTRLLLAACAAASLTVPSKALAWGDHYTVTDRALSDPSLAYLDELVPVESLDDFLKAQPEAVAKVFADYYAWLNKQGSQRFKPRAFDPKNPTTAEFLAAARLQPTAFFPLIERTLPGDTSAYEKLPLDKVSPYVQEYPPLTRTFKDATGQQMKARAVLYTFVDEPDWQMDHALWTHTEYGYGKQPFGNPQGESSKAPFHMKFQHENWIVRTFAKHIVEGGMVLDRAELCLRLSRLAFESGHPYWGYRFTAWALHYVQDLTQPYHSRAVPGKGLGYYIRYAVSFRKDTIQARTTQVESNRHFLYEDFVAYSLQEFYLGGGETPKALAAFLAGKGEALPASSMKELIDQVTESAADHARTIDKTIAKAFPGKMTDDYQYDIETDTSYRSAIADTMAKIPAKQSARLLEEAGHDFALTGKATRAVLAIARPKR